MLGLQAKLWGIFLTVFGIVSMGILATWVTDRYPPVETIRIEIDPRPVQPGEQMKVQYDVIRHRVCETLYFQTLIDGAGVRWDLPELRLEVRPTDLGEERRAVAVTIPDKSAVGNAIYRNLRRYYCNPLQRLFNWPIVTASPNVAFHIASR